MLSFNLSLLSIYLMNLNNILQVRFSKTYRLFDAFLYLFGHIRKYTHKKSQYTMTDFFGNLVFCIKQSVQECSSLYDLQCCLDLHTLSVAYEDQLLLQ